MLDVYFLPILVWSLTQLQGSCQGFEGALRSVLTPLKTVSSSWQDTLELQAFRMAKKQAAVHHAAVHLAAQDCRTQGRVQKPK